ncbi:MAG: hypothetical protein EOM03_01045 [Clostridia bacterium]|nr:hypothetical protein [Clostridia bacterium]
MARPDSQKTQIIAFYCQKPPPVAIDDLPCAYFSDKSDQSFSKILSALCYSIKKSGLDGGFMFKYLAAFFMLIDHFCLIFAPFLPEEIVMLGRSIGRLAFPMFAYSLARGYNRSSNLFQYFLRLSIFAVLTQLLFILLTTSLRLPHLLFNNVLITFALAIAMLAAIDLVEKSSLDMMVIMKPVLSEGEVTKRFNPGGIRIPSWAGTLLGILLLALVIFLTIYFEPDYSLFGLITVLIFQRIDRNEPAYERTLRKDLKRRRWLLCLLFFALLNLLYAAGSIQTYGNSYYAWIEMYSILAIAFFPLYERGKKPSPLAKYFFYAFYPLHFALLLLVFAAMRA